MEKHHLNLSEITNIKTLWHAAWLFSDKRNTEIILRIDYQNPLTRNSGILKAQFMILCEGILNSSIDASKERHEIDYSTVEIKDVETLASELSRWTGFKFVVAKDY
ncbi:MAG TPA: hypothetical protein PKL56_15940 [Cyclobacteriaceae bacterium]|nr:hypothetical protein [Cyclobacteriaceae bacterium]HMX00860.1 hypothetical protein [Cyclobacteriaceae bacterium]HMY93664.1 hypothetical protein [Cyclobacteriaceae bacterium]HNA12902.1 hypothetical protein [Cyclobacteriaceae bacterium]HNE94659.1 hypothetical protein [Cyclobacteriaceae bacterium]